MREQRYSRFGIRTGLLALAYLVSPTAMADGRLSDELKQAIDDRVSRGRIIGIALGVIDADGREYFAAGRVADLDSGKPDENTVFEIGSITKAFVGVLLADMIARDEVALDDPIDKFLPKDAKAPTRDWAIRSKLGCD